MRMAVVGMLVASLTARTFPMVLATTKVGQAGLKLGFPTARRVPSAVSLKKCLVCHSHNTRSLLWMGFPGARTVLRFSLMTNSSGSIWRKATRRGIRGSWFDQFARF